MSKLEPLLSLCALTLCLAACPSGDDGTGSETGDASTSSSETDSTMSETGTGTETDTSGQGFACGELECAVGEACLTFPQSPNCSDKPDNQPCPDGTTETQCGGAGLPCCCEPPPPSLFQCADTSACGDVVECGCLPECVPACSATGDPQVFICEEPPAP